MRVEGRGYKLSLPGLSNVDHVDTVRASLPQVGLHVHLQILAADVALSRQEHLDVLCRSIEGGGEVRGCHLRGICGVKTGGGLSRNERGGMRWWQMEFRGRNLQIQAPGVRLMTRVNFAQSAKLGVNLEVQCSSPARTIAS